MAESDEEVVSKQEEASAGTVADNIDTASKNEVKEQSSSVADRNGVTESKNEAMNEQSTESSVDAANNNSETESTASVSNNPSTADATTTAATATSEAPQPKSAATHTLPGSIAQIPRVTIPKGQSSHTEPCPLIGPGWLQQAVHRTTPSGGTYKNDRIFISPEGRRFKSYTDVLRYLSSKGLTIDTKNIKSGGSNNTSPRPPAASGPGSGKGIDMHPYQRGSVIEVLYVKRTKVFKDLNDSLLYNSKDDDNIGGEGRSRRHFWWEDEDSLSDWFNSDNEDEDDANNDKSSARNTKDNDNVKRNVWLCDIIDRAALYPNLDNQHPEQKWKYYIHYRDFNRRMDEWIPMERVISPPSVGNAKVRALKKKKDEEEKERIRAEMMKERLDREKEERRMRRLFSEGGEGSSTGGNAGDGSITGRRESSLRSSRSSSVGEAMNTLDSGGVGTGVLVGGGGGGDNRKRHRRSISSAVVIEAPAADNDASRLTRRRRGAAEEGDVSNETGPSKPSSSSGASALVVAEEHTAVDVVTTLTAQVLDEHEGMDEAALKEHEEVTKIKNVAMLELGQYQMDTWYFSPLPKEMFRDGNLIDVLYVDEFTLNFFTRKSELLRFQAKTLPKNRRHPPGNEIYRCGNLSMFEVDGFEERQYCQNLCYIAKLFLDHKTLYFDVDPFLFYVLCEVDERGYHPVGYYSKEKYSDVGYNLACILTFPSHQRKGYGRFLIAFSYELSKKEEKVGSPEKPMSDLGQQAYIPYWTSTIVDFLLNKSDECKSMSIMDIAKKTSIMAEDIIYALNTLGILKFVNGVYFISAEKKLLEDLAKKHPVKEPRVDPSKLHWTPYLTDVKRDKFSLSSKKASITEE